MSEQQQLTSNKTKSNFKNFIAKFDKEAVAKQLNKVKSAVKENLPNLKDSLKKSLDKAKSNAKSVLKKHLLRAAVLSSLMTPNTAQAFGKSLSDKPSDDNKPETTIIKENKINTPKDTQTADFSNLSNDQQNLLNKFNAPVTETQTSLCNVGDFDEFKIGRSREDFDTPRHFGKAKAYFIDSTDKNYENGYLGYYSSNTHDIYVQNHPEVNKTSVAPELLEGIYLHEKGHSITGQSKAYRTADNFIDLYRMNVMDEMISHFVNFANSAIQINDIYKKSNLTSEDSTKIEELSYSCPGLKDHFAQYHEFDYTNSNHVTSVMQKCIEYFKNDRMQPYNEQFITNTAANFGYKNIFEITAHDDKLVNDFLNDALKNVAIDITDDNKKVSLDLTNQADLFNNAITADDVIQKFSDCPIGGLTMGQIVQLDKYFESQGITDSDKKTEALRKGFVDIINRSDNQDKQLKELLLNISTNKSILYSDGIKETAENNGSSTITKDGISLSFESTIHFYDAKQLTSENSIDNNTSSKTNEQTSINEEGTKDNKQPYKIKRIRRHEKRFIKALRNGRNPNLEEQNKTAKTNQPTNINTAALVAAKSGNVR